MRAAFLGLLFLALGCHARAPQCPKVWVDGQFTKDERKAVLEALAAWHDAGVCIAPTEYLDRSDLRVRLPTDPRLVASLDAGGSRGPGRYVVGFADRDGNAWILVDRVAPEMVYAVTMHEIGHLLGLEHYVGTEPSWMQPRIDDSPITGPVTERDRKVVCGVRRCRGGAIMR